MKQIMIKLTTSATICFTLCCKGPVKNFWEHPSMISNFYLWQSACSFTVSCFRIKFIGWGPKRCKSRYWSFGISGREKSWKSPKFVFWDMSGNPVDGITSEW